MVLKIRRPLLCNIATRCLKAIVVTALGDIIHHSLWRRLIVSVVVASCQAPAAMQVLPALSISSLAFLFTWSAPVAFRAALYTCKHWFTQSVAVGKATQFVAKTTPELKRLTTLFAQPIFCWPRKHAKICMPGGCKPAFCEGNAPMSIMSWKSTKLCPHFSAVFLLLICSSSVQLTAQSKAGSLGIFEGQTDVGKVIPAGKLSYSASTGTYTVSAAGWDLWAKEDGFHYVWKKLSGDLSLTADIDFPVKIGEHSPNRKAVLMVRQSLDADDAYVDVAQHGSGMTALQYRRAKGEQTAEHGNQHRSAKAYSAGKARRCFHHVRIDPWRAATPGRRDHQAPFRWAFLCGSRRLRAQHQGC